MATTWPGDRFGFVIPQVFHDDPPSVEEVRRVVTGADQAGLHSVWTQSQLVGRADVLEPLTLLGFAAALTDRVRLGTAVINAPEHNPIQLAKQLSSLDVLSAGRLIVGLGMGSPRHVFEVTGVPMDRPVRRLLETRATLAALWTEEPASFEGGLWRFEGLRMNPKPIQRPHPPVWLCGRHPNSMRRSVRYGDGWMGPGASSIEEFVGDLAELERALDECGRARGSFTIAKRVYVAVESTREVAEERLRARFAAYSGNPDRATVAALYGPLEVVREGVARLFATGIDLVVLNPVYDVVDQQQQLLELVDRP